MHAAADVTDLDPASPQFEGLLRHVVNTSLLSIPE